MFSNVKQCDKKHTNEFGLAHRKEHAGNGEYAFPQSIYQWRKTA